MSRRPKILMIAPAVPDRTGNGLAMRLGLFLEALARIGEVDLVVLPTAGRADASAALPESLGVLMNVLSVEARLDTQFALLGRLSDPSARLAAFRAYGRPSSAACVSGPVLAYLRQLGAARSYDLVHVGRIYLGDTGLAARGARARLSLDLDEDDYVSHLSMADAVGLAPRRRRGAAVAEAWFRAEADAYERLIAALAPRYDRLWISGPEDRGTITGRHPGLDPMLINNGVAIPSEVPRQSDGRTLLFVGTLSYEPNAEGILWFAEAVWPHVRARLPGRSVRTLVIGAHPPRSVQALESRGRRFGFLRRDSGIKVLGRVGDLAPFYRKAAVAIAPLRAGRGTRIKLLEAAAHAVPIVATRDAARGLPSSPPWARLADDPAGFAEQCIAALHGGVETDHLVRNARDLVTASYDRAKLVEGLAERFEAMLG